MKYYFVTKGEVDMKTWREVRAGIQSISEEEKKEIEISANLIAQIITQRQKLGLTQEQVALKSGLKQAAIARLERNTAIPRIDTLAKVSHSLGLTIELVEQKKPCTKSCKVRIN